MGPSVYISLTKLVQCFFFFSFLLVNGRDFDLVSYYEMSLYQQKKNVTWSLVWPLIILGLNNNACG